MRLTKKVLLIEGLIAYTVKKDYPFSRLQPDCHLPNSPWLGIIKSLPARESIVSDIPIPGWRGENG
jgi:hypothetical protein